MKIYFFCLILFLTPGAYSLSKGSGKFTFTAGSKKMNIWYYIPGSLKEDSKVLFVMHGTKRNGEDYRDSWEKHAMDKGFILLVPEFSSKNFPGSRGYNLANMFSVSGKLNPKEKWHFSIIEEVFKDVKNKLKIKADKYSVYGHSAGAQFVHRFVLFFPEASLDMAISANAGWYTFPDGNITFPYGVKGIELNRHIYEKKLIVLLGDRDTDPNHKYLRKAKEAMAQGKHRFERGHTFYRAAAAAARNANLPFKWKLIPVKGVAHSNSGMAEEAVNLLK